MIQLTIVTYRLLIKLPRTRRNL